MPVVSITRLRVRSVRHLPAFLWYAFRSGRQAAKAEGNIAARVMNDCNRTFWTATVWTTDAAMKNFMMAGPHRDAMRKLLEWCDEAALVHWDQEIEQPPAWPEAYRRLRNEGRRSKVNHPSAAHTAYTFAEPLSRRGICLK